MLSCPDRWFSCSDRSYRKSSFLIASGHVSNLFGHLRLGYFLTSIRVSKVYLKGFPCKILLSILLWNLCAKKGL